MIEMMDRSSESTLGFKVTGDATLKELERENARLKKLLAEAELDKTMLEELAEGNVRSSG